MTDLCVHGADIRVPLGLGHDIAADEAAAAFDVLAGFSMFFVPRGLLRGVRLALEDVDRVWGDGAVLTGSAGDIVLAVLARRGVLQGTADPGGTCWPGAFKP